MLYVILGDQVLKVDAGYLEEPQDIVYPLFPIDSDIAVGSMRADILQKASFKVPRCYAEAFQERVYAKAKAEYDSMDIKVVLRLVAHSSNYINYIVGPVLMESIRNREGGQYFAYVTDKDNNHILYAGNTAIGLEQAIRFDIRAGNSDVVILHDKYLEEALAKLLEVHIANDICQPQYLYSTFKDPLTIIPKPGEEEATHEAHCEWCLENGLDGKHGNHWAINGTTYTN